MKRGYGMAAILAGVCIAMQSPLPASAQANLNDSPIDSVYAVEGKKDCFRSSHFFFGGQPSLETLEWLKSQGVTVVINLRTEKEAREFCDGSYDEKAAAERLGMAYVAIPLGEKGSYSPKAVDAFAEALEANSGAAFVHCLSCGRVTYLWMAYLVRHRGYSLDDAVAIGKRMKYSTTLEDLLGEKITLAIAKE